jgi:preprotein translocase subunit SecG
MTILFLILIVVVSVLLAFFVLIQNPKGGGLSGNVGGIGNQLMGVKQTTDVLEKGTWIFAAIIAVLCITSSLFLTGSNDSNPNMIKDINTNQTQQPATPANQTPAPAPSQQPGK